jgi:hypothetical protein
MFIEDGTGSGKKAAVTDDNQLIVHAYSLADVEQINEALGQVFEAPLDAVAPSGATWFWILQNNGRTTYAVSRIIIATSTAGVYRLSKVSGTPAGGTNSPVSTMNLGLVNTVDNLLIQTGASITGIAESNVVLPIYLAANTLLVLELPPRIFLPPGAFLALKAPGAATVNGCVEIYADVHG